MSQPSIPAVTDRTFQAEVLSAEVPVLVELTAPWCAPCRTLARVLHRLAEEEAGRVKVVAIDIEQEPALAARLGVKGVPTVVAFARGKEVARQLGVTGKERLLKMVSAP